MKPAIEPAKDKASEGQAAQSARWTLPVLGTIRLRKLSAGQWALGLFGIACLIGIAVIVWPEAAGLSGLAFLVGLTLCGAALMFTMTSGRLVPPEAPARLFGAALDTDQRACCITAPDGSK